MGAASINPALLRRQNLDLGVHCATKRGARLFEYMLGRVIEIYSNSVVSAVVSDWQWRFRRPDLAKKISSPRPYLGIYIGEWRPSKSLPAGKTGKLSSNYLTQTLVGEIKVLIQ